MAQASSRTSQPVELRLLLLGKTGHGKSSTGNTILSSTHGKFSEETFDSDTSSVSVTTSVKKVCKNLHGYCITVVDTPGVCDTEKDDMVVLSEIATAVMKCSRGYDAFVIVLRYPTRLTREEREALQKLEQLFGEEMFDFTICLFTNGSTFYNTQARNRNANKTVLGFEEEIYKDEHSGMQGAVGPFVRRCKGGMVLFDNLETDHSKRKAMVQTLLQKVADLKTHNEGKCYNNQIFQIVREETERAAQELNVDPEDVESDETIPKVEAKAHKSILKKIKIATGCTIL